MRDAGGLAMSLQLPQGGQEFERGSLAAGTATYEARAVAE